jgi:putative SOS response-associated peptidase YedK
MCGRYRLSRRKQFVEEYFDTADWQDDWTPRYNIAPTQPIPVVRQNLKEPVRELSLMRWGLIPHWSKDPSGAAGMINARSETAGTKPAFRDPLKFRRCLIPADGFYEWSRKGCAQLIQWKDGHDNDKPGEPSVRLAYYRRRCGEDWWEYASQMTVTADCATVKTLLEVTLAKTKWFCP